MADLKLYDPDSGAEFTAPPELATQLVASGHAQLHPIAGPGRDEGVAEPADEPGVDGETTQQIPILNPALAPNSPAGTPSIVEPFGAGMQGQGPAINDPTGGVLAAYGLPWGQQLTAMPEVKQVASMQQAGAQPKTIADYLAAMKTPGTGGGGAGMGGLAAGQAGADKAELQSAGSLGAANASAAAQPRSIAEGQIQQGALAQQAANEFRANQERLASDRNAQQQARLDEDRKSSIDLDQNGWWAKRNTGQKIMAGLGVALGSLGSAFTKGPNFALDIINKAIDQDFEAKKENMLNQRANTSAQGNFVADLNRQGFTEAEARDMNAIRGWERAGQSISMLQNTLTDPQAKAQAEALKASALEQIQARHQNLARLSNELATGAASRIHLGIENNLLGLQAKVEQLRLEHPELFPDPNRMTIIGGSPVQVPVGADAKKLGSEMEENGNALQSVAEAMKNQNTSYLPPGLEWLSETGREGKAAAGRVEEDVGAASKLSPRLLRETLEKQLPSNVYSVWSSSAKKLSGTWNALKARRIERYKENGMPPARAKATVDQEFPDPAWVIPNE